MQRVFFVYSSFQLLAHFGQINIINCYDVKKHLGSDLAIGKSNTGEIKYGRGELTVCTKSSK